MKLIEADVIKQKYRDKFIKSLVDKDRGIDLSEYAEEPSKSFNRFIDEIPTVDVLEQIRGEIAQLSDSEQHGNTVTIYGWENMKKKVLQIIDKFRKEQTDAT